MYEVSRQRAEEGAVNTEFEAITAKEAQQISAYAKSVLTAFKSEAAALGVFKHIDSGPEYSTYDFFMAVHELLKPKPPA